MFIHLFRVKEWKSRQRSGCREIFQSIHLDYFIIPQRSEKQDEAKAFLRFVFSTEYMPNLANDLQAPLAIDFDDSKCDKNAWYKEVDDAMKHIYTADGLENCKHRHNHKQFHSNYTGFGCNVVKAYNGEEYG